MPFFIPIVQSNPNYRLQLSIGNAGYLFDFRWNTREGYWYLDVYDVTERPIRTGMKCVVGTFLGRSSQEAPFADGALIVYDTSGKGLDAGLDDFGSRVQMVYLSSLELLQYYALIGVK